ncbi:MAG: hypothetical protein P4L84_37710 [Isosphaeraceae bacterium]|nr:hypothetical protein [Isosphaeraceae bacterium]
MTTPKTPAGSASAIALALFLLVAPGCNTQDIELAEVPPDATEKVLKAQIKPKKPQPLPPQNQMSKGQPY